MQRNKQPRTIGFFIIIAIIFIFCALCCIFLFYRSDLYFKVRLAVAVASQIARLLFVLDHEDFSGAADFHDFRIHFRAFDMRRADSCIFAIVNKQNLIKGNFVAFSIFGTLGFYFLN